MGLLPTHRSHLLLERDSPEAGHAHATPLIKGHRARSEKGTGAASPKVFKILLSSFSSDWLEFKKDLLSLF